MGMGVLVVAVGAGFKPASTSPGLFEDQVSLG